MNLSLSQGESLFRKTDLLTLSNSLKSEVLSREEKDNELSKLIETVSSSVNEEKYDEYLKDIYMAQFIELAYFYSPPGFLGHNEEYNQKIEKRLQEIVDFHFK